MFQKKNRLPGKDLKKVLKNGRQMFFDHFNVKYQKNNQDCGRFAIIISNKIVKSAAKRNRAKRLYREAIKKQITKYLFCFDMVILVKKDIESTNVENITRNIEEIFHKLDRDFMRDL